MSSRNGGRAPHGGPENLTAGGSLPATWREHAERDPRRPSLHDPDAGWITRGELAAAGTEVSGRLYAGGLRLGDRVLLCAPSGIGLVAAHTACLRIGLVVVPLNAALRRDGDGYLHLEGRSGELIISGDSNVYPRELEEQLADHPDISEVAVAGRADEDWGEVVTAYVVPVTGRRAPSVAELRGHAADRLAAYKHPRAVVAVESIPRNALGKVQRHLLANVTGGEPAAP